MAVASVFDVASWFLARAPKETMESVKLQKLCFYAFGWYAHQTGRPLFDEPFYAMPKGPVVGELLSSHAGSPTTSPAMLDDQFAARGESQAELDPYARSVLDAVWGYYGRFNSWQLVDLTHKEAVWDHAWKKRSKEKRGDLPHVEVIEYFIGRSRRRGETLELPETQVTFVDSEWLRMLDEEGDEPSSAFLDAISAYLRAQSA